MSQRNQQVSANPATDRFLDVLAKKTQRLHAKSLAFLYSQYPREFHPEEAALLDLIPRKIESKTVWTPEVRLHIITLAEMLDANFSGYAPFNLAEPFNGEAVRRMLPRLALLIAGRLLQKDEASGLRYWLRKQQARQPMQTHGWTVEVHYNDGRTGPHLHPTTSRR